MSNCESSIKTEGNRNSFRSLRARLIGTNPLPHASTEQLTAGNYHTRKLLLSSSNGREAPPILAEGTPAHPGSVGPVAGAMLVEMTVAELRCSTVLEVVSGMPVLGWPTDTGGSARQCTVRTVTEEVRSGDGP